jgi:hypothetical protein
MSTSTGEQLEGASALPEQENPQVASSADSQGIPVHVLQSMREEMKALKENNSALQNHVNMMQWQQQNQRQQPVQPQNPFNEADLSEPLTKGEGLKALSELKNYYEAKINEVKIQARAPDYNDVINKYLPLASKEDPDIIDEIKNSSNPHKTAYKYAIASQAYQNDLIAKHKPVNKPDPEVAKMVSNSKQSGNLASVGNNATSMATPKYSQMTDEEFRALKSRNMMKPGKANIIG